MEGAARAFEARARGASAEEVLALAIVPGGRTDPCAPWPSSHGDSSGSRRSCVDGPSGGAKVLFRHRLAPKSFQRGKGGKGSPVVLPDLSVIAVVVKPTTNIRLGDEGVVARLDRDGALLWAHKLKGYYVYLQGANSLTAFATGDIVLPHGGRSARLTVGGVVETVSGIGFGFFNANNVFGHGPMSIDSTTGEICAIFSPAGGFSRRLMTPGGKVARVFPTPVTTPDGRFFLSTPAGISGYDRACRALWELPIKWDIRGAPYPALAIGERLHVLHDRSLLTIDPATGSLVSEEFWPASLALDSRGYPVPLTSFGEELTTPAIDASDRVYAGTQRGTVVGFGPDRKRLFEVQVSEESDADVGPLALGPGRLYLVEKNELVCIGNP